MKATRIFILSLVFILNYTYLHSQTLNCKDFHRRNLCFREAVEPEFKYYGQSASAVAEKGTTMKYNAIFYGGKDYVINLCTNVFFKPVHFTIYDADTQELIYDNEEDDYINKMMFSVEFTRSLTFEITVIKEDKDEIKNDQIRDCLGILILWRKTPKIGF